MMEMESIPLVVCKIPTFMYKGSNVRILTIIPCIISNKVLKGSKVTQIMPSLKY